MSQLTKWAAAFHPTGNLFDSLAALLTDLIPTVVRRGKSSMKTALALLFVIAIIYEIKYFVRSAIKPESKERLSWFDRTLRAIFAVLLILYLWYGLFRK
jgi:hypothetical protein